MSYTLRREVMNKRIWKKHHNLKKLMYHQDRCVIGNSIATRCRLQGISYNRNAIWKYTHWMYFHMNEKDWSNRSMEALTRYNYQNILSAKHLMNTEVNEK